MYSYVWFDLGYTLVYREREKAYKAYLENLGISISLEKLEEAYHLADKFFMREKPGQLGKHPIHFMDEYLAIVNQYIRLQKPVSYLDLKNYYKENPMEANWKIYPWVMDTLETLQERGIRLGIISNWDSSGPDVLKSVGIINYFDTVVFSYTEQIEKPDQRIFEIALEKAGVDPKDCLYVGDNYYDDMVGCRKVHMDGALINIYGTLGMEELELPTYKGIDKVVASLL